MASQSSVRTISRLEMNTARCFLCRCAQLVGSLFIRAVWVCLTTQESWIGRAEDSWRKSRRTSKGMRSCLRAWRDDSMIERVGASPSGRQGMRNLCAFLFWDAHDSRGSVGNVGTVDTGPLLKSDSSEVATLERFQYQLSLEALSVEPPETDPRQRSVGEGCESERVVTDRWPWCLEYQAR